MDPEQERKLTKLYKDMYEGEDRDNPSITTRLTVVEGDVDHMKSSITKINSNISWGVKLLLGSLLLAIANLVFQAVKH